MQRDHRLWLLMENKGLDFPFHVALSLLMLKSEDYCRYLH